MWVSERDRKTAHSHLPKQETLPNVSRVAVHIGAATPSKRWSEDSFASLLHELHASTEAEMLLLGGSEDMPVAHEILDDVKCPVVNLVGRLSLRELAAVLKECRLFIGGDSGPAHLAAACGVPVVSLFSAANDPAVWKPWGPRVTILTRRPDCSPCGSHLCRRTDGYFCMDEIGVEKVMDAALVHLRD
jgi:ADP-heptose:LPS heptosyltransferase